MQTITPYLYYEDVDAALGWLTKAFGFVECGERYPDASGKTCHAAMNFGEALIMMGRPASHRSPKHLGQATQCLHLAVDKVDERFQRAVAAGAEVIQPPQDKFHGQRMFGVADPEGHLWFFAEPLPK